MAQKQFITDFNASVEKLMRVEQSIKTQVKDTDEITALALQSLTGIKATVDKLNTDFTQILVQVAELKTQVNNNAPNIAAKETQVADLIKENARLETDKQAVLEEIKNKQEGFNTQSVAIQNRIDDCEKKLRETDVTVQRQTELTAKITELESQLKTVQEQLEAKTRDSQAEIQTINQNAAQALEQTTALTNEIAGLKAENDELVKRIVNATNIINTTVGLLDALQINPNITGIRTAIGDVERSLENIGRAIQGQLPRQDASLGGKKTKKNRRKQKGGFTYKNKANRRTITTSKQAGGFIYKDSAKRRSITTSSTKRKRKTNESM